MHNLKLKSHLIKLSQNERLYQLDRPIIGLTGGIACGKSTVAKLFQDIGCHVINADELIHKIYQRHETIELINKLCPSAIRDQNIDFKVLRSEFFNNEQLKSYITSFLYQRLPDAFMDELETREQDQFVIYDVPLLFENNLELKMDQTLTVYTPVNQQIQRLIERDQIDNKLAQQILTSQMSPELKRQKADFVLDNSGSLSDLKKEFQLVRAELFL